MHFISNIFIITGYDSDEYKSNRDSGRDERDRSSRYDDTTSRESEPRMQEDFPRPEPVHDQTPVLAVPPPPIPANGENNGTGNGAVPIDPAAATREARRRSRWSTTKAFVPGMPTILPSDMDETQRDVYLRKFCIYFHGC